MKEELCEGGPLRAAMSSESFVEIRLRDSLRAPDPLGSYVKGGSFDELDLNRLPRAPPPLVDRPLNIVPVGGGSIGGPNTPDVVVVVAGIQSQVGRRIIAPAPATTTRRPSR